MKTIQDIAFEKFNSLYVGEKTEEVYNTLSKEEVATFLKNIGAYGYRLSKEATDSIISMERGDAINVYNEIIKTLDKNFGDKGYKPYYLGFPEEVLNKSDEELYFDVIMYYIFGYQPKSNLSDLKYEVEESSFLSKSELGLVGKGDMEELLLKLFGTNVTMSDSDVDTMKALIDHFDDFDLNGIVMISEFNVKEVAIEVAKYTRNRELVDRDKFFKTATDVLRYIFSLSGLENLTNTKEQFAKFNRTEVKEIVRILDRIPKYNRLDDIAKYRVAWKRFFYYYGGKVNWKQFPSVKKDVDFLFGKGNHTTYLGKLDRLYDVYKYNVEYKVPSFENLCELVAHLEKRPGYFARRLIAVLSLVEDSEYDAVPYVLTRFMNVVDQVSTRVIYQLYTRVLDLDSERVPRMVKIKGNNVALDETRGNISDSTLFKLKTTLDLALDLIYTNRNKEEGLGKVYVDDSYKNFALTTSEKGANASVHPITTGSRVKLHKDSEVYRLFVTWKNLEDEDGFNRVDVDISANMYSSDLDDLGRVAYYSRDYRGDIEFSGDITDAPDGAVEYIDIRDIDSLVSQGVRYIGMNLYDYTSHGFNVIGNVHAGVMELTKEDSMKGINWVKSSITNAFSVSSKSRSTMSLLFDLERREYIWVDSSILVESYVPNNSLTNQDIESKVLQKIVGRDYITMYDVLVRNAKARGVLVDDIEDADIVFEEVSDANPLPLNEILADYI